MKGCRELPKNGENVERKEVAVSCLQVPEIGRNGGIKRGDAVSCREVPEIGKNGE